MRRRRPLAGTAREAVAATLGAVGIVEDIVVTVRSHRLTRDHDRRLAESARCIALAEARRGCTHSPECAPAAAPDRTTAAEVWADDACVYLCNGLVLAVRETRAPDSPSSLYPSMPQKETTP